MSYLGARELARRICAAAHPHYATTGNVVPCGPHTRAAALYDELTTEKGTRTLAVILRARAEAGLAPFEEHWLDDPKPTGYEAELNKPGHVAGEYQPAAVSDGS